MRIEFLIFFYMAISILMGLFDFCFLFYERHRDKSFAKKSRKMAEVLGHEIETNADFPTEGHKQSIRKKMKRLSGLESFDLTMERFEENDPDKSQRYLVGIVSVFEYLSRYFSTKSDLHKAYFAYIVRRWYRAYPASKNMIIVLLRFVNEGSLYVRQNALEALAKVGTPQALVEAMVSLEKFSDFHHPKLITEVTMAFRGSDEELATELDRRFTEFRPDMQAAIVNFMRMKNQGDPALFLKLLQDERENSEVRLACIRYFMRHKDSRVATILQTMALSEDAGLWEFSAVSATVLGSYIDDETIAVLIKCLSSPIWYVRLNASKSLYDAGLKLDGPYLKPVMDGSDRYAKEMLRYRWELEAETQVRKAAAPSDGAVEDASENSDKSHHMVALPSILSRVTQNRSAASPVLTKP